MSKHKDYPIRKLFLVLTAAILVATGLLMYPGEQSLAVNQCGPEAGIITTPAGTKLSGNILTQAHFYPSQFGVPSFVEFKLSAASLGAGQRLNTNDPYNWQRAWNTSQYQNGPHLLSAHVVYTNATGSTTASYACDLPSIAVTIDNPTSPNITAPTPTGLTVVTPPSREGPTNVNLNFEARAYVKYSNGTTTDVTPGAAFVRSTTLGTVKPDRNRVTFFSGPTGGNGEIKVVVSYSGFSQRNSIPVYVVAGSTASGNYPAATTSPATSTAAPTIEPTAEAKDPDLANCLKAAIGEARFVEINAGRARPTADEAQKMLSCFATRQNIVPANFSPVAPTAVKNLPPATDKVKVDDVETKKVKGADGKESSVLEFSGRAVPNSLVFLYVFSEPLVLTTKADKDGNWSYTLENPLKPGDHEVYVAVEQKPGEYVRSAPRLITVARAAATEQNPQGNSLELASGYFGGELLYLALLLILIVFAIRAVIFIRRRGLAAALAKGRKK